jgi:hypothetical protein
VVGAVRPDWIPLIDRPWVEDANRSDPIERVAVGVHLVDVPAASTAGIAFVFLVVVIVAERRAERLEGELGVEDVPLAAYSITNLLSLTEARSSLSAQDRAL